MTVSYFSRDDAEKAWNELPPEEQCKTRIVMQPSYYLAPITLCREWIDLINKITHKRESNHDA